MMASRSASSSSKEVSIRQARSGIRERSSRQTLKPSPSGSPGDGARDPLGRARVLDEAGGALEGHAGGEEPLDREVVQVAGDAVAVLPRSPARLYPRCAPVRVSAGPGRVYGRSACSQAAFSSAVPGPAPGTGAGPSRAARGPDGPVGGERAAER